MKMIGPAGTIYGGIAANKAGKYTRKVMKANAANAINDGLETRDRIRTASRLAMGRQLVEQGGSGFGMGSGSALDALHESAIEAEIDLATSRRQSALKAQGFNQQGDMAAAQGKSAMIGGFFSGAAQIVDEVSKAYTGGMG